MTAAAFDFRRPPPGDLERHLGGWVAASCRLASAAWPRLLPYPAELKPGPVEAVTAATAAGSFPDDAVGFPLTTPDPADGTGLLVLRRPLLLALLAGLLGETPAELPADRDPTELEASLIDYLARELFLVFLEKTWPGAESLRLTASKPGPPRAVRRGDTGDMVVLAALTAATPFGDHPVHLLLPRAGVWERLARGTRPSIDAAAPNPEHITALVREMSVDLAVILGTAELTMSQVARLSAGDVVIFRQKVDEPLDGLVAGARKFRVWPGAVGNRTAIQVHAPATD